MPPYSNDYLDTKEDWIKDKVLRFLMRNALTSILASLLVVVVYSWANWTQIMSSLLCQLWVVYGVGLAVVRLIHYGLYTRDPEARSNYWWLNGYRLLALCSGMVYGIMTVLFFQNATTPLQVLNMFIVVGMPSAAVGTHSVDGITFRSFMLTIVIPAAIILYLTGDTTYRIVAFLIFVFCFIMDRSAKQTRRSLLENIELTYQMSYRATHDTLVGLYNREEFEHQFEMRALRSKRAISMMFVDLDNFKSLNDTLGHQTGDDALVAVANVIKHAIRSDDIAARLGGDEFVVIMFLDQPEEAELIANEILQGVTDLAVDRGYKNLSASIGISFHIDSRVGFSRLMRVADMACYQSKEKGKNRVTLNHYALHQQNPNKGIGESA